MIKAFIAKFYETVILIMAVFLLLTLSGLGVQTWRANHWEAKYQGADAECVERINKVNTAYQTAIDAWRSTVFIVENELEAERNNIKIQFRDIKYETQKVATERIYTDCKLNDAGMSVAESARIAANTRKSVNAVQ